MIIKQHHQINNESSLNIAHVGQCNMVLSVRYGQKSARYGSAEPIAIKIEVKSRGGIRDEAL